MKKNIILILFIMLNAVFPAPLLGQEKQVSPEHSYNTGIDFYKQLDYNKAIDNFRKAFNTEKKTLEQWINYNLGNASFEQGQQLQKTDPQQAQQAYAQALEFFRRAIELNPKDTSAKHNYELTALKIQEAKQQQEQEDQQQKDQQQQDEQQEQKDQQQQDEQQQQKDEQQKSSKEQESQGQKSKQQVQPQEMTEEQAKMLLENFQNSEDRPTELRLLDKDMQSVDVEKDW